MKKRKKPKESLKHIKCFQFLNNAVILLPMEIYGTEKHKQTKMYAKNKKPRKQQVFH